jgi:hypothetical protein
VQKKAALKLTNNMSNDNEAVPEPQPEKPAPDIFPDVANTRKARRSYKPDTIVMVCQLLRDGEPVRFVSLLLGIPQRTIRDWRAADKHRHSPPSPLSPIQRKIKELEQKIGERNSEIGCHWYGMLNSSRENREQIRLEILRSELAHADRTLAAYRGFY